METFANPLDKIKEAAEKAAEAAKAAVDKVTAAATATAAAAQAMAAMNPALANVPAAFHAIPQNGTVQHKYSHADFGTGAHIQGMGAFATCMLFTHNKEKSNGFWAVGHSNNKVDTYDIATPDGFQHPGGFQVIGQYAAVGIEKSESDNTHAHIYFYDISGVESGGPKLLSSPQLYRDNGGAACVGIVRVNGCYVLAAYTSSDSRVHFYQSNQGTLGQPTLAFGNELFSIQAQVNGQNVGYDNLNLVADQQNNIYLVGLRAESSGTSFDDFADLLKIDMAGHTFSLVESRHLSTNTQGLGITGSHFRYGAGTQVVDANTLHLYCSSRLFTAIVDTQLNFFY